MLIFNDSSPKSIVDLSTGATLITICVPYVRTFRWGYHILQLVIKYIETEFTCLESSQVSGERWGVRVNIRGLANECLCRESNAEDGKTTVAGGKTQGTILWN
jgi:hypothetical protein